MRSTFVALVFCILISHHFVNAKELRFECNVLQGDDCWFEVYSYGYKVEHFDLHAESLISFHNYQLYQSSYITFGKFQVQISSQPGRQESSGEIHLHAERTNKQTTLFVTRSSENNHQTIIITIPSDIISINTTTSSGEHALYLIERFESATNNWMQQLGSLSNEAGSLGSMTLSEIALPGTHDSGTFSLTLQVVQPPDSFAGGIDEICQLLNDLGVKINCTDMNEVAEVLSYPWSVTQKVNWKKQLEQGCRSFDYRGYQKGANDWVIQHSLTGTNLTSPQKLSEEVVSFLEKNPGEIVIIEYTVYTGGDEEELINLFMEGLGQYAYHWESGTVIPGNPTISQMIANNQRAIVVKENDGQQTNVTVGISNDYPNSCNDTYIHDYDANAVQNFAVESSNAMRKIAWQVTADAGCIVFGTVGTILHRDELCAPWNFTCSIDLMGYIDQLDAQFEIEFVLNAYSEITPISEASYFGNLWNFDHPDWSFIQSIPSLDIILLSNSLNHFSS